ncbi:hypothetical protein [Couchioplanes caeruleus]|uniref:Uncharacterized protein n=2 Tax=Couchioplanes caeruleus TaxID=56438 RepID=A0A1K0GE63_9ACTN|nr:hypothetical protein BG844_04050 [Couchioplanes caeruleus subsp. caeruleus]ROP30939.1 hypothetical protein EDD30_3824 [Couchioplanes caeruleus]
MTARTMRRHHRTATAHTGWCAADHRCNLAEHRSHDMVIDLPDHGRAVLTRVQGPDGRQHAEIRARIVLHTEDTAARWQLRTALAGLRQLLGHVAIRPGVMRTPATRHTAITTAPATQPPTRRNAA